MIRKLFLSFIISVGLLGAAAAQTDQRTRETKIADIVMQMPANNQTEYSRLMAELFQISDPVSYLAPLVADPGGKDAQIRYAIAGMAMYASNKPELKPAFAAALCKAIDEASSDEKRDFFFIQLQYVADEASIRTVARYLLNDRLCDAAVRTLVRIGGDNAGKAMLAALRMRGQQQSHIVEGLGDLCYAPALDLITLLAGGNNPTLQKTVLYSLSRIANDKSQSLLQEAAEKVGYRYDPTDALGAYVRFLNVSLNKNNATQIANMAKKMMKAAVEPSQVAAKTAALEIYLKALGAADKDVKENPSFVVVDGMMVFIPTVANEKAVDAVITALKDPSAIYRKAAFRYSMMVETPKMYTALMKKAKKEKDIERQAEFISAFGMRQDMGATDYISGFLSSPQPSLRCAAIRAIAQLRGADAVDAIIKAMTLDDDMLAATGKSVLMSLEGKELTAKIGDALTKVSIPARIAFIDLLAERKAVEQSEKVFQQTEASHAQVRLAADQALAQLAVFEDIPRIAKLLNTATSDQEVTALQNSMYAAFASKSPDLKITFRKLPEVIAKEMDNSPKPERYYRVLAMISGQGALVTVQTAYFNDPQRRDAAFDALLNWSDDSVLPALLAIGQKLKGTDDAKFLLTMQAYVSKASHADCPAEEKLLLLRKALDISDVPAISQAILQQIGRTGTFLGLIVAGQYLDNENLQVQQAAVQAVRSIAMAHPEYYGKVVKDIITKAIAVNKNPEADYQKQELLKHIEAFPADGGFVSMFNGKDLTGWKGLVENPIARAKMTAKQLADKQKEADKLMHKSWRVENGLLVFEGDGYDNLCSEKDFADFEMFVDWKIGPGGDAGVYLRGTPQVQVWDNARTDVGAEVGSGGLYNNQKPTNPSKPLMVADNPVGEWNSFYIKMIGEKVTVYLNGHLVVDNTTLENYWDRSLPIFPSGAIELQAHASRVEYRDIYVRSIPRPVEYTLSAEEQKEGFVPMFNGIDMSGWIGNLKDYQAKDGQIICDPENRGHGNLYTEKEYSDFVMRFEFLLTPAANNGLGIRTPLTGDAAYAGMELQILDNEADVYKNLNVYQYHGSVYGVIPAKRGYLKPVGEWNTEEVTAKGNHITVKLNGTVILDGDIAEASKNFTETADHKPHPGLSNKSGHIGFLGHGSWVAFRNLRIKDLAAQPKAKAVKSSKTAKKK